MSLSRPRARRQNRRVVVMLAARALAMLVGLYYLAWVAPTFMHSFGSKPLGFWAFTFVLPLVGAVVSLYRPVLGGTIVLLCAAYEGIDLIRLAFAPGPADLDRAATMTNEILLWLLPALIAGTFLVLAGWKERQAQLS